MLDEADRSLLPNLGFRASGKAVDESVEILRVRCLDSVAEAIANVRLLAVVNGNSNPGTHYCRRFIVLRKILCQGWWGRETHKQKARGNDDR
jgi:hypothetical protein